MTALVLIAVERHLDGHYRQAFAIGFFAALDRPEVWLFWGPYGLWLFWRDPGARKLVFALFALIPILWFAPEYWGSGHFFRGVTPRASAALQQRRVRQLPVLHRVRQARLADRPVPDQGGRDRGRARGRRSALWRACRCGRAHRRYRRQRRQALAGTAIAGGAGLRLVGRDLA